MPRIPRSALDGECCHVLNRGQDKNGKVRVVEVKDDGTFVALE